MASHPQLALSSQLCLPLYAAARGVTRRYAELLAEIGLTYPQYLTMLALWDAGTPLTVGDIGARLRLDSGTLTPVLKRLESAGYVARHRDDADERRVLVDVTPDGDRLRERVADVPERAWRGTGLGASDAQQLRRLLDQLLDGLDASAAP
ncbi:MarR family transcriptional regulator [Nocardioides sp. HM23]|uniref:MarR family winged helix-turn-helix transcriptional regulator n=1 Tax=Nocardioides bizhenqiangii TaxID=3095076 RepID=UPI002ACAA2C8|nr:MarR family transcriptional regulator [Nocardioides sp. HM23]MDZ5621455.1 MarR family transcriptional regulator [Nocardioides sp. HM23]